MVVQICLMADFSQGCEVSPATLSSPRSGNAGLNSRGPPAGELTSHRKGTTRDTELTGLLGPVGLTSCPSMQGIFFNQTALKSLKVCYNRSLSLVHPRSFKVFQMVVFHCT